MYSRSAADTPDAGAFPLIKGTVAALVVTA